MTEKIRHIARGTWPVALAVCCVAVAAGCIPPDKPSDREADDLDIEADEVDDLEDGQAVVARVGGREITREEFNRRIDGLADFARARLQSDQRREDFLNRIVEFEVMADEAHRQGLEDHARVRHAVKETMVDLMIEDHLSEQVSMADIDDEDRHRYFENNTDEFHEPERRRIARLVVDDREKLDRLFERWDRQSFDDPEEAGRAFRRFAFRFSDERETGDDGGDLGWRKPDDGTVFDQDVFEWEPGVVKGPFEEDDRYVLKMVVERQEPRRPGLEDLEQELTSRIYEQRRDQARRALVDEVVADARVERFEHNLEQAQPPETAPPPLEELPRETTSDHEEHQ